MITLLYRSRLEKQVSNSADHARKKRIITGGATFRCRFQVSGRPSTADDDAIAASRRTRGPNKGKLFSHSRASSLGPSLVAQDKLFFPNPGMPFPSLMSNLQEETLKVKTPPLNTSTTGGLTCSVPKYLAARRRKF